MMEYGEKLMFLQNTDAALAEIEHTLDQMLVLAQLSASDLTVDRAALQKTLERLQHKIDLIADQIKQFPPSNATPAF